MYPAWGYRIEGRAPDGVNMLTKEVIADSASCRACS
jgi:hypothetical protein